MSYYEQCHYYEEHANDFSSCPGPYLSACVNCPYKNWKKGWISVDESLPLYRKNVLVITCMGVVHVAKLVQMGDMQVWVSSSSTQYGDKIISHWCDALPADMPN